MDPIQPTALRHLPFWRTVIDAYAATFRNLGYLAQISWAWIAVMTPVSVAFHSAIFSMGWHQDVDLYSFGSLLAYFGSSALTWLPLASIAVAWHRKLLAGEVWPRRAYLRSDRVVGRYFGLAAMLSLLVLVPAYPLFEVNPSGDGGGSPEDSDEIAFPGPATIAWLLALCAGLFVSTKYWLVLPARALGKGVPLDVAWTASHQNFWRLFVGGFLCIVPISALYFAVLLAFELGWVERNSAITYAVGQTLSEFAVSFFGAMPVVTFLSLAYRWLVEGRTEREQVSAPASSRGVLIWALIGLVLFAAGYVASTVGRNEPHRSGFIDVPPHDEEMAIATKTARASLDHFWQTLAQPHNGEHSFNLKVRLSDGNQVEHFWLQNPERTEGRMFGTINNDPVHVKNVKLGQRIEFTEDQISDWMFVRADKIVGNYTVRALFKFMPKERADEYKEMLVDR